MTEGLLNSIFHDRTAGDRRRDLEAFRGQLADAVFRDVGQVSGRSFQAADLPLFRRSGSGLEQVVRFRLLGAAETDRRFLLAVDGATAPGPYEFKGDRATPTLDVFVAEVAAPQTFQFRVLGENGDVLSRGDFVVRPQRKWSVSLVHHTHLDVGYTDRQEVVADNHLQYLDSVLELVDHTGSWDDDARFRWNVEVNWPLERWFERRSERDRRRMIEAVNAGRVGIGAMSLNMHTEACAVEELYEMVRFAVELRNTHGVAITSAMQTDVPGGVTGLVEVLSDAGVQYLSVAHNFAGRSVPYLIGGERLERPFYWKAPSGKRVLVWFTDTLHGNAYMEGNILGLSESFSVAEGSLPCYLAALAERPYPFDSGIWLPEAAQVERDPYPYDILHLRVQGKYGDNAPPNIAVSEVAKEWNSTWAYPHLRVDRNEEFFAAAVERLGDTIPEWQGDWADWWADGLGSGARMLGWAREAQGAMRVGTTLHTLTDLFGNGGRLHRAGGARKTYEDIGLFDEHTWGARSPWEDDEEGWGSGDLQWQRKASYAQNAREAALELVASGARLATDRLTGGRGLASIVVFNSSGWARTDVVRVFLPHSTVPATVDVAVEDDRDGTKIATVARAQEHVEHRPAGRFLEFLAREVPALGYARFNVVEGSPVSVEVTSSGTAAVANEYYEVAYSLPEAWVDSVKERGTGRELVNRDALLGLNAYIFDRYATSPRVDHLSGRVFSRELDLIAERRTGDRAVMVKREVSELGESMTLDVRAPGCSSLLTTISLWRGVPRVDIKNRMWKLRTVDKQSVFFAFPLASNGPDLVYELPGLGTNANAPTVPGSPQHMRAIRHWAALGGDRGRVAWASVDAPLVQFGDIHSPYTPFPGTLRLPAPEPATIYSWVLNNIWDTNFPTEQGGEMRFRYAIASQTDGSGAGLGARLGDSISTPLVGAVAPSSMNGGQAAPSGSICAVERPEVSLVQATVSANGDDLLLWLNNLADGDVTTRVEFPGLSVRAAKLETVFEEGQVTLPVQARSVMVNLRAGETRALAVQLGT
jgi:Glycosyl hydrolases family 38 N-terminal domain